MSRKNISQKIFRNAEMALIEISEFGSDREFPTINTKDVREETPARALGTILLS